MAVNQTTCKTTARLVVQSGKDFGDDVCEIVELVIDRRVHLPVRYFVHFCDGGQNVFLGRVLFDEIKIAFLVRLSFQGPTAEQRCVTRLCLTNCRIEPRVDVNRGSVRTANLTRKSVTFTEIV